MSRAVIDRERVRAGRGALAVGFLLAVTGAAVIGATRATTDIPPGPVILAAAACACAGYLAWSAHPAHLLIAGLLMTPFAGWSQEWLHIPGVLAPQRLLLLAGVLAVLLRAPAVQRRAPLRPNGVLLALSFASAYALLSALASQTLTNRDEFFRLFEAFGLLPFAVFAVAPAAFAESRHRDQLLAAAVLLGAYLGLTALFETFGPEALIYPRYILAPSLGVHFGRARGPFLEAVTNGAGLYVCAVLSIVALARWQSQIARLLALATALLCVSGVLFTMQRSVWIGAIVATIVVGLTRAHVRRVLVPTLIAATIAAGAAYAALPSGTLHERATNVETVWARKNLNRAGLNLLETRPLVGVGWGQFVPRTEHGEFFEQAADYPLTGVGNVLHNQFLSNAVELGLVGAAAWLIGLLLALAGGLTARVPEDDLLGWKTALLAYAIFFLIVSNFAPTHAFPNLVFWLLAGIAWTGRLGSPERRVEPQASTS